MKTIIFCFLMVWAVGAVYNNIRMRKVKPPEFYWGIWIPVIALGWPIFEARSILKKAGLIPR